MMNLPTRVAALLLAACVSTFAGCAKSISVSPQEVVLSAAQPSAQVMVTRKWPHTVAWNLYNTDLDGILVTPDTSYDKTTRVTVTATDLSAPRSEKITFFVADADGPETVLNVHVQ